MTLGDPPLPPADPSSLGTTAAAMAILLVLALAVVLERLHTRTEPLERDIAGYALISHEMLNGRDLYSDLWDRKPPGLYVTFAAAERAVGYGPDEVLALNLAAALATLLGCYAAGRACGGAIGGLGAATLWALVGGDLTAQANQPNAEVFVNAAMAAAVAVVVCWPARPARRWIAAVATGVLFALATLYKHHVIVACAAIALGHVVVARGDGSTWKGRLAEVTVGGAVLTLIWVAVLAHFAAHGRLDVTLDVLFRQDVSYATGGTGGSALIENLIDGFTPKHLLPPAMGWALVPLALVAAAVVRNGKQAWPRPWRIGLFWAVGTAVVVAAPGFFHPHYYQLWMPAACIAGGWAIASLSRPGPTRVQWAWATAAVVAVAAVRQGSEYRLSPEQWSRQKYSDALYFNNDFALHARAAAKIASLLRPGETFYNLGDDTSLYFLTRKSPPTGLFYIDAVTVGPDIDRHWVTLMSDLDRTRPDLIVVSAAIVPLLPPNAPIFPWMKAHYVTVVTSGDLGRPVYHLNVRRGSDLYRRLAGAASRASASRHPTTSRPSKP